MTNSRRCISIGRIISYYESSCVSLALLCVSPKILEACESSNGMVGPWRLSVTSNGHRKIEWRSASAPCHSTVSDAMRLISLWINKLSTTKSSTPTHLVFRAAMCMGRPSIDLHCILDFSSIVHLTLSQRSIKDVNILGKLPSLRRVELIMLCITNSGILGLADCKSLQEVSLWGCSLITDVNFFGNLPGLQRLILSETSVCDSGIIALSKCENLKEFSIDVCDFVTSVGFLGKLPRLQRLSAEAAAVKNDSIPGIGKSLSLEDIDLWGCRNVRDVGPLADIPTLRRIDLGFTAVGNDSIASIRDSKSIEEIELKHCTAVTDVYPLACIPTLRRVSLNLTPVLEKDVAEKFPGYVTVII